MIDVLIPMLGRPERVEIIMEALSHAPHVNEVVFICSPSDKETSLACQMADDATVIVANWEPEGGDFAKKINLGFRATESPYLFLGASDLDFTLGWDVSALKVAIPSKAGVVGTNDDANPLVKRGRHSTHPLVSRDYIEETGGTFFDGPRVVYHEGYDHQWVDTELVTAAQKRGQWDFARRSLVRHLHPFYDKTQKMDATYKKALQGGSQDKALFDLRYRQWRETA